MNNQATYSDFSGVPLASLPAIVLDTETTGLDVTRDRIIEIAAVHLGPLHDRSAAHFCSLVNPGSPIPPSATAIHGINDRDVARAPDFATVIAEYNIWAHGAIVIGFSIGFDLAVLKAEHARAGLPWRQPRSLDVRHLLQIVQPDLPEQSLEAAAAWLGLQVGQRHRALADAELTAGIFLALLPKLKQHGVRTMAEAERACRMRASQIAGEVRAGWQAAPAPLDMAALNGTAFPRIDSFPYRHRVRDLMASPPLTIRGTEKLSHVLRIMSSEKVSSLFLEPADTRPHYGIITERDVLRALDASGAEALDRPTALFAKSPLVTIGEDEFVYRALARMAQHGFRHLGVVNNLGALTGALSARDLLRQRADDAVRFGSSIETAETTEGLGRIWLHLPQTARALALEDVDARSISSVISHEVCALTRRACELAEQELVDAGLGRAPVPFAMMVLGSGGRGESLLAMDQDNAIVFSPQGSAADPDAWLKKFAARVSDILDAAGVSYCKGGVMASNAAWRMDLTRWRETIQSWISRSRSQDILNCDIFFDARPVYGTFELADQLRGDAIEVARHARIFLSQLALNASDFSSPIGWFGQLKTEQSRIDLKKNGIMPIFSTARVAALRHGITDRSTVARLQAVSSLDKRVENVAADLLESHRIFMDAILKQQFRDLESGLHLTNSIAPAELTHFERKQVKWALRCVPSIADILGTPPATL